MHSQKELIIMDLEDNIGFVKQEVSKGQKINIRYREIEDIIDAKEDIPFGFKIALRNINQGEIIYKFGEAIGIARIPIAKGEMVHVHNVDGLSGRGDLTQ